MSVIAKDVAAKMVAGWEEEIGVDLKKEARDRIIGAVAGGRLDYIGGKFAYRLIGPVHLENATTVDSVTVAEPTGGQLREAAKAKDDMEGTMRLLSAVSGVPLAVFDRIGQRDILTLSELIGFFG
jgi:hypothetical protein